MSQITRRMFVTTMAVVPLQSLLTSTSSAAELPQLSEQEPMATALGYVEASGTPNQTCGNCSLYTSEEGAEWGNCAIFQGKLVATAGWCKSWVLKPA